MGQTGLFRLLIQLNSTEGSISPSIALDSNNNPHIIYLETVQYQYPNPNSFSGLSFWDTYNVKYASLTGSSWYIQTLFANASNIGNLVLDSKGQPSFCYVHESWTYLPEYGSFLANGTTNYAYWNGHAWLSRIIDSKPAPSGQTYLRLDSTGNPQVYFYVEHNQEPSSLGLMCASWTGSSWNVENLGSFPLNTAYYQYTENVDDTAFDSHGNPSLTIDGEVGTIRAAPIRGDLTYVSLESTGIHTAPSTSVFLLIIASVIVLAVVVISLLLYIRQERRKLATIKPLGL